MKWHERQWLLGTWMHSAQSKYWIVIGLSLVYWINVVSFLGWPIASSPKQTMGKGSIWDFYTSHLLILTSNKNGAAMFPNWYISKILVDKMAGKSLHVHTKIIIWVTYKAELFVWKNHHRRYLEIKATKAYQEHALKSDLAIITAQV